MTDRPASPELQRGEPMGPELAAVVKHVDSCAACTAANKRVNDLCPEGRLLFAAYQKVAEPTSIEEVEITDEQYARLVAGDKRARRAGEN